MNVILPKHNDGILITIMVVVELGQGCALLDTESSLNFIHIVQMPDYQL